MKKIIILLIFIFIVILGYFSASFFTPEEIEDKADYFQYEREFLYGIKKLELQNTNLVLKDQMVYFGTDSIKQNKLSNVVENGKICFYFSEKICPPCIDYVIDVINNKFTLEEQAKIIYLSPDYAFRLRANYQNKQLMTLKNKYLDIPLYKKEIPFLFYINKDLKISYLHIHNKTMSALTDIYLNEMKKIIKSDKE